MAGARLSSAQPGGRAAPRADRLAGRCDPDRRRGRSPALRYAAAGHPYARRRSRHLARRGRRGLPAAGRRRPGPPPGSGTLVLGVRRRPGSEPAPPPEPAPGRQAASDPLRGLPRRRRGTADRPLARRAGSLRRSPAPPGCGPNGRCSTTRPRPTSGTATRAGTRGCAELAGWLAPAARTAHARRTTSSWWPASRSRSRCSARCCAPAAKRRSRSRTRDRVALGTRSSTGDCARCRSRWTTTGCGSTTWSRAALGAPCSPRRTSSRPASCWRRSAGGRCWSGPRARLVIEDDYDAEYRYDRAPVPALQASAPDRIAYTGSTSKTLAPGLRLGLADPAAPAARGPARGQARQRSGLLGDRRS